MCGQGWLQLPKTTKTSLFLGYLKGKAPEGKGLLPSRPQHPSPGKGKVGSPWNSRSPQPAPCQPHAASLGGRCSGLGLLVFLARPLAVQCSRVKIAGVEGTALTLLLSASPPPRTRRLLVLELQLPVASFWLHPIS